MALCAETGTVLYSRIAALPEEDWRAYVHRVAAAVHQTGLRCILRPMVVPENRSECAAMRDLWHELTC
jgi:hypothetical protein